MPLVFIIILASLISLILLTNQTPDLFLPATILSPLAGALFIWLTPKASHAHHRTWALIFTFISFIFSLMLWAHFDLAALSFQHVMAIQVSWKGTIWLSCPFGIDGFSLWMIILTTALFPLCVICSWNTLWRSSQEFMVILLILESMLLCVWSVLDLLAFYVFYESVLIPMFLLIAIAGSRDRKIKAAYQLVLYTLFGSLLFLPCLLSIYTQYGTTNLELLYQQNTSIDRQLVLWWGFFFAFAVKIPMVPLHLWLPEAHVEASTAGSVILAGVLLKLGGFGFLRLCLPLLPYACQYYSPLIYILSLIALIYTSLTTLRQVDLKKIIAYSSVAHMSLVMLALFSFNDLSYIASMFFMLSHGIISPALFLCVGFLYDRHHTKLLKYLGGASYTMPLWSIFFFFFTLANMAMPLFPSFIAEFLCLTGVFATHSIAAILAFPGMIFAAAYSLWAYARVVHGLPKPNYITSMSDLCRREVYTLIPLVVISLWLGFKPGLVLESLEVSSLLWQQLTLL